jgi:hypothetical protein
MNKQEKAKEIYNKMRFWTEYNSQPSTVHGMCKHLALICVDEIIENGFNPQLPYNYWDEVKQEIDKL